MNNFKMEKFEARPRYIEKYRENINVTDGEVSDISQTNPNLCRVTLLNTK